MLRFGSVTRRTCQGITRRELVQVGGIGTLGLTLADALRVEAKPARELSCILFWLSGGPSQHETFDPKPDQPLEIRGPYAPVETNVSGVQICSLLPQLARVADTYCLLRSLAHGNPDHSYLPMLNGDSGLATSYGAVVTKLKGSAGAMPPFVNLGPRIGLGAGPLGSAFDAIDVPDPASGKVTLPDFDLPQKVDGTRFQRRRRLVEEFDALRVQADASGSLRAADATYQRAFGMLTAPHVRRAFDLSEEPTRLRERYGASVFGQSCLMARRLVEAGTRFVQVQWSDRGGAGWDTHGTVLSGIFEMEQYLCPRLDQGLSALLRELKDRGLLESTLVLAIAEFGRTPRINARAGRDHWPQVFSALIAGAGIPGGTVVGASDSQGAYPATRPIHPGDLAATLYRRLGLDILTDERIRPYVRGEVIPELT